jgi:hypothetical protein
VERARREAAQRRRGGEVDGEFGLCRDGNGGVEVRFVKEESL